MPSYFKSLTEYLTDDNTKSLKYNYDKNDKINNTVSFNNKNIIINKFYQEYLLTKLKNINVNLFTVIIFYLIQMIILRQ